MQTLTPFLFLDGHVHPLRLGAGVAGATPDRPDPLANMAGDTTEELMQPSIARWERQCGRARRQAVAA